MDDKIFKQLMIEFEELHEEKRNEEELIQKLKKEVETYNYLYTLDDRTEVAYKILDNYTMQYYFEKLMITEYYVLFLNINVFSKNVKIIKNNGFSDERILELVDTVLPFVDRYKDGINEARFEIAKNLLEENIEDDKILKYTRLNKGELDKIKKKSESFKP